MTSMIDKRAFLGTMAGGLLAAPLVAEGQPAGKVPLVRVGRFIRCPQGRPGVGIDEPETAARSVIGTHFA
jgi:hypothetical protein